MTITGAHMSRLLRATSSRVFFVSGVGDPATICSFFAPIYDAVTPLTLSNEDLYSIDYCTTHSMDSKACSFLLTSGGTALGASEYSELGIPKKEDGDGYDITLRRYAEIGTDFSPELHLVEDDSASIIESATITIDLQRTDPETSYANKITLHTLLDPTVNASEGLRYATDCTPWEDRVGSPTLNLFARIAASTTGGSTSFVREGLLVTGSSVIGLQRGIFASCPPSGSGPCLTKTSDITPYYTCDGHPSELSSQSLSHHLGSPTPSDWLDFDTPITGEPSQIKISRVFRTVSDVRGDVAPAFGVYDADDKDAIEALIGVDIEDDPDGLYEPEADMNLDGVIDEDDLNAFINAYCPADVNHDHTIEFSDYLEYLNLYGEEDPAADMNGDSVIEFADELIFLDRYAAGC